MLVAALTREAASDRVRAWLRGLPPDEAIISDWVRTEVSSALSMKARIGALSLPERAAALAAFHRMVADSLLILPVTADEFLAAGRYADLDATALRAADALHVAVCARHVLTLHTLDRRLHDACLAVGVRAQLL